MNWSMLSSGTEDCSDPPPNRILSVCLSFKSPLKHSQNDIVFASLETSNLCLLSIRQVWQVSPVPIMRNNGMHRRIQRLVHLYDEVAKVGQFCGHRNASARDEENLASCMSEEQALWNRCG